MTTASEEKQEGSAVAAGAASVPLRRQVRARVSSVTPDGSVALQAVTDSAQAVRRAAVSGVRALDRPGTLIDAQPPTFRQARAYHHRCAGEFNAWLFSVPRIVWGYLHMAIAKPALNLAEWVTESPLRAGVAVIVWLVIRHWG